MSGDLLTLRMLVVCPTAGAERRWREGAAHASVPIEFHAERPAEAIAPLKRGGFDIVMLDGALPQDAHRAALEAARGSKPVPLVVTSGAAGLDGVDLHLPATETPEEARALVERCIRVRLPKRALIVDDSRTMRSIVRKILAASRFSLEVAEAESGEAAVGSLGDRPDIVLLDCNLPGADGFAILSEIKKAASDTIVVMMTATGDETVAGRAQSAGADAFLKKPFYPADIDAVLTRIYSASK